MSKKAYTEEALAITEKDPLTLIEKRDPSVLQALTELEETIAKLEARGVTNIVFDPSIVRGFDYYTGVVFEIFDITGEDTGKTFGGGRRSLFGGGRYDYLIEEYGGEHVPAIGFGMGDVTLRDFLEKYSLLPDQRGTADIYLAPATHDDAERTAGAASFLREKGVRVALGMKHEKTADHIKAARKLEIPFFAVYGEKETSSGTVMLRDLRTKEEKTVQFEDAPRTILNG